MSELPLLHRLDLEAVGAARMGGGVFELDAVLLALSAPQLSHSLRWLRVKGHTYVADRCVANDLGPCYCVHFLKALHAFTF